MSTDELVRLLNDDNHKDYNENTVRHMHCNKENCGNLEPIDQFMKVVERTDKKGVIHQRKTFYKCCQTCRDSQTAAMQKHRKTLAKDLDRTRKAVEELNNKQSIPESSLTCTGCNKRHQIATEFKTITPGGQIVYVVSCATCRASAKKRGEERRHVHQADTDALTDDMEPVKCAGCGFKFPVADFIKKNGDRQSYCSMCRERQRAFASAAKDKRLEIHQERIDTAGNILQKCTNCFKDRPSDLFKSKNGTMLDLYSKCRDVDLRQPKNGHRVCVDCHHKLPLDDFNLIDGKLRSQCKRCVIKQYEETQKAIKEGQTMTHSPHVMNSITALMQTKNLEWRKRHQNKHPEATDAELDDIAPLQGRQACLATIKRVLMEANCTCDLCGRPALRIQRVEDLEDGNMERASMQRIDPRLGFLSDLRPKEACQLIDLLFGHNGNTPDSSELEDTEIMNIKSAAAKKDVALDVLLDAASSAQHRCALTGCVGTFNVNDNRDTHLRIDCLSFDRIVPGREGGQNVPGNIQVVIDAVFAEVHAACTTSNPRLPLTITMTGHQDRLPQFHMPLHDLRSRINIVPQDPVHSNMDPFNDFGDDQIFEAFERGPR
ncbi:hypothetical protein BC940DRAFT_335112 [Gongronella butleri]|nr:hypothetical protein BC940DRAFT_335112 [Gongronella butleri]